MQANRGKLYNYWFWFFEFHLFLLSIWRGLLAWICTVVFSKCTLWLQGLKVHKSKIFNHTQLMWGIILSPITRKGWTSEFIQGPNYNPYNTVTQISTAQSLSLPSTPKMWNPLQSVSNNNVLCSFRVHNCLHIQYNYSFNWAIDAKVHDCKLKLHCLAYVLSSCADEDWYCCGRKHKSLAVTLQPLQTKEGWQRILDWLHAVWADLYQEQAH